MSKMLKVVGASWLQTKISSYILGILGVLAILAVFVGQFERIQEDGNYAATVFHSDKTGYRIEYWGQSNDLKDIPKGVARAHFRMDIDTTGWSLLEIETDGSYPDEIQAYAAGIVEGALTWYLIHTHLDNTIRAKCENQPLEKQCDRLRDALDKSVNNWKMYAEERANSDPFWHHVSLYYTQISGIFTGWGHGVVRSTNEYDTDISDLYWLNSVAEVNELQHKLNISLEDTAMDALPTLSSAFLRIINETLDDGTTRRKLFVSQNAAGNYSSMTRILKRYKFNYRATSAKDAPHIPGTIVQFTSYPGSITSQDEFYLLQGDERKMAVTGTPLRNYNKKLWKNINIDDQVPVGPRVTVANRLATNVSSWSHLIAGSNSGTGCKQWLVVDFNRLDKVALTKSASSNTKEIVTESTVNKDVRHTVVLRSSGGAKGLMWLLEQVPARTHSADLSDALLDYGYWATYGLPFFKDIAEITHVNQLEHRFGNIFSESESPRTITFKKGYKNATSLDSIIKLMRQINVTAVNNASDSRCTELDCVLNSTGYWSDLGARGDMFETYKEAYGIIDTKVVSGTAERTHLDFIAISGPPYTEVPKPNSSQVVLNKGTVASTYTDQFDDEPTINSLEMRDLVRQQQEDAEQESWEELNKNAVKPFQWSESDFNTLAHESLPDKWAFGPYKPMWSW